MAELHNFNAGGYAFLEGGFPYSQAVIALPGFALRRIRFSSVVPVEQALSRWRAFAGSMKVMSRYSPIEA